MASGEADRIFDLFFRGQEAAMLEPEETGFGLYLAQFIAGRFRSQIRVFQDMVFTWTLRRAPPGS